jgi:hypothetical protein
MPQNTGLGGRESFLRRAARSTPNNCRRHKGRSAMLNPPEEKHCGDCSLCCKIMAITELNKPKHSWCDHVVKKRGCGIYQTRPHACRAFKCLWLLDPRLPPEWKPNKSKFVMVDESRTELIVHVDSNSPGTWRDEPYFSGLRSMAERGQAHGQLVVIMERGHGTVLLADREVPVGALEDDDRIVSGHVATSSGPRFEVKVMKAAEAARLVDTALQRRTPKSR